MASSYTGNSGIEKPADGDQSGSWGDTINTNMDIIDRSINGVGAITLSGTTHTLTTTDGTLSDGMYKVLVLGGSPSGTNTITIAPNDADKVYIVVNSSGQTATFTQGSGANVSVLNGDSKIIYADGAGSGAAVVDVTADLSFSSVNIDGGTIDGTVIGGASAAAGTFTTVTASGEIDGASLDISGNADIDGTLETDALSIASTTVTSTAAELNYNDTGAAVGTVVASKTVTADANKDVASFRNITLTGELDAGSLDISGDADIDGTLETDALSIASTAVTATAAELNYLDITTLGTSEASKAVTVDSSGDLIVPDSDKFKFGAGSDMQLYHDGTNSYITNGTGILKIATETSGIAINIGHGTSEVTFGDNVTVTGDFTVNGTTTTINTTNLTVTDPLVKYGQGYTGTAYDEGFIITRGNGSATNTANKGFIWDESADEFAAIACNTEDGTTAGNVTINSYADLQVNKLTGGSLDISGDVDVDGTLETDALSIASTAVTSTAAELNILDGVTSTAAELNILDGVTSTAAELNYLDITTLGTTQASKAVTTDSNGDVVFPDGDKINLGTGSDLVLQHDGSHSYIQNSTGNLNLQGKSGEDSIVLAPDGAVTLYYDNVAKLATTSTGASITTSADTSSALSISRASGGGVVTIESYNAIGGIGTTDNIPFRFNTNNTERVRIANDGNIAIGATGTGDNKLTVEGGVAATNGSSLALKSGGGANSRVADLAFYGTFVTPDSDTGQRRTADITSGFSTANWGNEYLAIGVGTGGANDSSAVTTERMRIAGDGKVGVGTAANLTGYVNLPESDYGEGFNWFSSGTAGNRGGVGHYSYESRIYYGSSDNLTFVDGGPSGTERMRIAADGKVGIGLTNPTGQFAVSDGTRIAEINPHSDGTYIGNRSNHDVLFQVNASEKMRIDTSGNVIVKKTAAGGVTIGADSDTSNTSDTFLTLEGTSETHGSAVIQKGLAGNTTFYQNVVYHVDTQTTQEVSRITGSGTNGFMMLVRVHTCGHTSSIGDGYDIKYYTWAGASSTPTQVYTLGGGGNNPDITVTVPSANILVVNVSAANTAGVYTYRGAVQIEYLVPNDFINSTWVVS